MWDLRSEGPRPVRPSRRSSGLTRAVVRAARRRPAYRPSPWRCTPRPRCQVRMLPDIASPRRGRGPQPAWRSARFTTPPSTPTSSASGPTTRWTCGWTCWSAQRAAEERGLLQRERTHSDGVQQPRSWSGRLGGLEGRRSRACASGCATLHSAGMKRASKSSYSWVGCFTSLGD